MKSATTATLAAILAAGCGVPDPRPRAEDIVCLCNGDLGCVIVRVDEKTPKASYQDETFYFCAESCRKQFEKEPERFYREALKRRQSRQ
jgi:YHS domain-containing protein